MFKIKQMLSKSEKRVVESCMYDVVDIYNDFYFTRDNIRISLRDNPDILFSALSYGWMS